MRKDRQRERERERERESDGSQGGTAGTVTQKNGGLITPSIYLSIYPSIYNLVFIYNIDNRHNF